MIDNEEEEEEEEDSGLDEPNEDILFDGMRTPKVRNLSVDMRKRGSSV
jgi:hypothetical protein